MIKFFRDLITEGNGMSSQRFGFLLGWALTYVITIITLILEIMVVNAFLGGNETVRDLGVVWVLIGNGASLITIILGAIGLLKNASKKIEMEGVKAEFQVSSEQKQ